MEDQISFLCFRCWADVTAEAWQAGREMPCPNCHVILRVPVGAPRNPRASQSPPTPPPPPPPLKGMVAAVALDERTLQRPMIRVSELMDFIADLPARNIVRKYPSAEDTYDLGELRRELSSLNPNAFLFDPNFRFALVTARKKEGWLCLEYRDASLLVVHYAHANELHFRQESDAQIALQGLRSIEGRVQIGLSRDQYAEMVGAIWLPVRDFLSAKHGLFVSYLGATFGHYHAALQMWTGHTSLPFRLIGGGFGFKGAVEGMMISTGVNYVLDAIDGARTTNLNQRLLEQWGYASEKLRLLEVIMGLRTV